MRSIFLFAALLAAAPALAESPTPKQLELRAWQVFKAKRAGEFKAMLAPDFIGIYADGPHDLAREMQSIRAVTLTDYRLSNFTSHTIDADDVLLTYAADVRGAAHGKAISERLWVASLWHRSHGKWLTVYHTEIKAK